MRLENKIALISAAASGMGRAGAVMFAAEGAKVVVVDIDGLGAAAVAKEINDAGGAATAVTADLTKDDEAKRIVHAAEDAYGGLDIVWNHVGHPGPASIEGDIRVFFTTRCRQSSGYCPGYGAGKFSVFPQIFLDGPMVEIFQQAVFKIIPDP